MAEGPFIRANIPAMGCKATPLKRSSIFVGAVEVRERRGRRFTPKRSWAVNLNVSERFGVDDILEIIEGESERGKE